MTNDDKQLPWLASLTAREIDRIAWAKLAGDEKAVAYTVAGRYIGEAKGAKHEA